MVHGMISLSSLMIPFLWKYGMVKDLLMYDMYCSIRMGYQLLIKVFGLLSTVDIRKDLVSLIQCTIDMVFQKLCLVNG